MRHYPIFNEVTACIYKASKSYGVKDTGEVAVKVGTSKSNSHLFVTHAVTRRNLPDGGQEFRFFVDGELVKRCQVIDGKKTDLPVTED